MRAFPSGSFARQAALGWGALRLLSRSSRTVSGHDSKPRSTERLPRSTAIPLWGVLSVIGWLAAAHLTIGLMDADERNQMAFPFSEPSATDFADFATAAGEESR